MSNQPPEYTRQYNFENFQTLNPTTPLPGDKVEAELNAARSSVNQTISRLNEIQNADGSLKTPGALVTETTATATSVATSVATTTAQAYLAANYDPTVATQAAASASDAAAWAADAANSRQLAQANMVNAEAAAGLAQNAAIDAAIARSDARSHAIDANESRNEAHASAQAAAASYADVGQVYGSALSLKNWIDSQAYQFVHKREETVDVAANMLFNDGEVSNTLIGKIFQGASVGVNSDIQYVPPVSGGPGNMNIYSGPWWVDGHESPEPPHRIIMRDMFSCLADTWLTFGPRSTPWQGVEGNIKPRQEGVNGAPNGSFHIGPERIKGVNYTKDNFNIGLISGSSPLTPKSYVDESVTQLSAIVDGKVNRSGDTFTGRVGIGVAPSSTAALKVDGGGIMFNDGTIMTTAATSAVQMQEYDNFKIYQANDLVLFQNKIFKFNNYIGAAGYGPSTHPSAWTEISSSSQTDLTGYATETFVTTRPGMVNLGYSLTYTSPNARAITTTNVNVLDAQTGPTDYQLTITPPFGSQQYWGYDGYNVSFDITTDPNVNVIINHTLKTVVFQIYQYHGSQQNMQDAFGNINTYLPGTGWSFSGNLTTAYYVSQDELVGKSFTLSSPYANLDSTDGFASKKGLLKDFSDSLEDSGLVSKVLTTNGSGILEFSPKSDFIRNGDSQGTLTNLAVNGRLSVLNATGGFQGRASINIGTLQNSPSTVSSGEIFITDRLSYVNRNGNTISTVSTNQTSTIATSSTNNVIQIDQTGSGGGLLVRSTNTGTNLACVRIEQRGTGNALVVQDQADPDATQFAISNNGRVGIGVTPDSSAALKVDSGGIMFNDGTTLTTAPVGGGGAVTSVAGRTGAVVLGVSDITNLATQLADRAILFGDNIYFGSQAVNGRIQVQNNSSAAVLTVTQSGIGNCFVVEDTVNPDSTPFTINNSGRVGIGVVPDNTAALKVDSGGIMFNDGTVITTAPTGSGFPLNWTEGVTQRQFTISNGVLTWDDPTKFSYSTISCGPSGAISFNNKITATSVSGRAGVNIGIGGDQANSTTPGDLWIPTNGVNLWYKDGTGVNRSLVTTSSVNTFSQPQVISTGPAATQHALRITNQATTAGVHSLVVEDSVNPDATPFVIDNTGKVGVGVAPSSAAVTVDNSGVKWSQDVTLLGQTYSGMAVEAITVVAGAGTDRDIYIKINGQLYRISAVLHLEI